MHEHLLSDLIGLTVLFFCMEEVIMHEHILFNPIRPLSYPRSDRTLSAIGPLVRWTLGAMDGP